MKETAKQIESIPWYIKYAGQDFNTISSNSVESDKVLVEFPEGKYSISKEHVEVIGSGLIRINENLNKLSIEKTIPKVPEKNNGGSTDYYALPFPSYNQLYELLGVPDTINIHETIEKIISICPQTINDLIEFKNMMPWQHEVIKSCYAINERAKREGGSEERELNKQVYYINRRRKQLGLKLYKLED